LKLRYIPADPGNLPKEIGMRRALPFVVLLLVVAPAWLMADGGDDDPVARDEALAIKTTVKAVLDGLGAPPAGYAKAKEEFDLPTSMGIDRATKQFYLAETGADFEFTSGMSGEQMGKEYQAKIMAAQSKGDYAEIQRLSLELQQNMTAAMNTELSKITVKVYLNHYANQEIDPEGVIWETPGAIALRTESNDANTRLMLAFDPKTLADTKKISLISLGERLNQPASSKTAVRNVVVELDGPETVVTAWAKAVDKGKILALIKE
jgi:hypothetical protein